MSKYKYSETSKLKLYTARDELVELFEEALSLGIMDITIVYGHRSAIQQNDLYEQGKSQLQYPDSYHNAYPSNAIDAVPYPEGWKDINKLHKLNGIIQTLASQKGYHVTWGGDWKSFPDLAHWQYEGKRYA